MSMLSIMGRMAADRVDRLTSRGPLPPVRTPVPMGLHQESAVEFSATGLLMLEAMGSVMPSPKAMQNVVSVGQYTIGQVTVNRSYLSDGKSFIETIADPKDRTKATSARLYVNERELVPSNNLEWNFLLGDPSIPQVDQNGNQLVDQYGRPLMNEPGILGLTEFDLNVPANAPTKMVPFARTKQGGPWVPLEVFQETIRDATGHSLVYAHNIMNFWRDIDGSGKQGSFEYLLTDIIEPPEGSNDVTCLDIFVGIDVNASLMTVYPSKA